MIRLLPGIMIVWLGMLWAGSARADGAQESILRGKAATVLVDTKKGTGTAFCIDRSGLFVTNAHVVEGIAVGETVKLALYPASGLMITVPESRDQLVLRDIRVIDTLTKAGIDYLFVASTPPTGFGKGRRYRYQIEVRARRSPARLHLESGPHGMTLTPGGMLSWDVPPDYSGREETIVITIKDSAGQSIFHTFKITLL